MRKYELDPMDELDHHLTQLKAILNYLSVDFCNNNNLEFSVNSETVAGMLWTTQTLIENAIKATENLRTQQRKG